jgi:hypothetical protein
LAPALKAYAGEPTPVARRFVAVFLILQRPGSQPYVHAGVGRWDWQKPNTPGEINNYRQNWWCTFAPPPPAGAAFGPGFINTGMLRQRMNVDFRSGLAALYPQHNPLPLSFLTADEKTAAAQEWASLLQVPAAPDWLAQQVLAWAKAHPDDARLPEALHRVVVSSRFGCDDADTGAYSKQAFTLLHTRYPQNQWTMQTPYWYK